MITSAEISDCRKYRYRLDRVWDPLLPTLVVCMLNPSTADAESDDPTMRRIVHFGKSWGYGAVRVVNLYPFRASKPDVMFGSEDRLDSLNDHYLADACDFAVANGGRMLAAWGNDGDFEGVATKFCRMASNYPGLTFVCLGTTISGAPTHPMALGRGRPHDDQQPAAWHHRPGPVT